MKDTRFYLEFPSKRAKKVSGRQHRGHAGNVVAVFPSLRDPAGNLDALGGVYEHPNSPVGSCGVNPRFLRERCKRISEPTARLIHSNLFRELDRA